MELSGAGIEIQASGRISLLGTPFHADLDQRLRTKERSMAYAPTLSAYQYLGVPVRCCAWCYALGGDVGADEVCRIDRSDRSSRRAERLHGEPRRQRERAGREVEGSLAPRPIIRPIPDASSANGLEGGQQRIELIATKAPERAPSSSSCPVTERS